MLIRYKDGVKLISIVIITFCAAMISSLFLNYNLDLKVSKDYLMTNGLEELYFMLKNTGYIITIVCGFSILITTGIMLTFYIKNFIDQHKKEYAILKALGYSSWKVAKHFWVFSLCVFIGGCLGFLFANLYMPRFYEIQGSANELALIDAEIHYEIVFIVIIFPTVFFALFSMVYSFFKLNTPVISLLYEKNDSKKYTKEKKNSISNLSFLQDMKKATIYSRKILVFFVVFSSFAYSAVVQTAYGVKNLTSETFSILMVIIGCILSVVTVFLSMNSVVNGNAKSISLMSIMGYTWRECRVSILDGYRKYAYIGFGVGTIYQYLLIKLSINVIFESQNDFPKFEFDIKSFFMTLISYILLYELIQQYESYKIRKIDIKRIMIE